MLDRTRELLKQVLPDEDLSLLAVQPLTGGVASDIVKATTGSRQLCVKFALPQLRVAEDWRAPVHRNLAEYRWLQFAGSIVPDAVPKLYGHSPSLQGFAMEYLAGTDVFLWKTALLHGEQVHDEAARVAGILGKIHAASADSEFDRALFDNKDDFKALRLEPYLTFTASRVPEVSEHLYSLASALHNTSIALVHGDVSPKNILFRNRGPVILDAECATMGDPAFDVAFLLNHLILKAVHLPQSRHSLLASVSQFWSVYQRSVGWEPPAAMEQRVSELLPALLLARVDGKSPVEYLDQSGKDTVRGMAIKLLGSPERTLMQLLHRVNQTLETP